jgi:Fic family protein
VKREELCPQLQREFRPGEVPYGVKKTTEPGFENIWFVVPPPPPETRPKSLPLQALSRGHRALQDLSSIDHRSELDRLINRLMLRNEAVSSSRMEGTWSTVDHVLTPEEELGSISDGKATHMSVRSYAHALDDCFDDVKVGGYARLNVDLVCQLHRKIMEKDPSFLGIPGQVRKPGSEGSVVFIGGLGRKEHTIYNPCPPEEVSRCLDEVMCWYQNEQVVEMGDAGHGLTLPIRLAIGHSHFEAVHPFRDGNGRVGRMLWPLQLVLMGKQPLYLSRFVEKYKDEYGKALQDSQKKLNYAPIVEFMCEAIVGSLQESQKTEQALRDLPEYWRRQAKLRSKSTAELLLDKLLHSPILNTQEVMKQTGVSFRAASRALDTLVEVGILRERTGFSRNRLFAAEEVISVLGRSFGDEPRLALEKARKQLR